MTTLTKRQILMLHSQLVEETGGSDELRDEGMLESALSAPFQTFDDIEVYPSILQKASRLCYGLVMNHPFVDGNKRIGTHAMLVFLALNGIDLSYTQEELAEIILSLAAGKTSFEQLYSWVISHQA